MAEDAALTTVELAAELTAAWLSNQNNRVSAEDVPAFLKSMHQTLVSLESGENEASPDTAVQSAAGSYQPAVSVRKSLGSRDHIISMIDGRPYKTLRRHLAGHGLTPEQYRERYNLKTDYSMVAPSYSEARRDMAKKIGLGSKRGARGARTGSAGKSRPQG